MIRKWWLSIAFHISLQHCTATEESHEWWPKFPSNFSNVAVLLLSDGYAMCINLLPTLELTLGFHLKWLPGVWCDHNDSQGVKVGVVHYIMGSGCWCSSAKVRSIKRDLVLMHLNKVPRLSGFTQSKPLNNIFLGMSMMLWKCHYKITGINFSWFKVQSYIAEMQ